jgi:outer membrane lipoprotein-sorting protein
VSVRHLGLIAGVLLAVSPVAAGESSKLAPFFARLSHRGRAEVRIERSGSRDGLRAPLAGRVVLEPPDRVRLDFDGTGERVTLRADGGEWLQPELRQMVRLGAARARDALVWWDLLLGPSRDEFVESAQSATRVLLLRREAGAGDDSVTVWLDTAGGNPASLRVVGIDGEPEEYRLSKWKFTSRRGAADFRLHAPAGYEVTVLP